MQIIDGYGHILAERSKEREHKVELFYKNDADLPHYFHCSGTSAERGLCPSVCSTCSRIKELNKIQQNGTHPVSG